MGNTNFGQTRKKGQSAERSSKFNRNSINPESKQEQPLNDWTAEGGFPGVPQNENNKNKGGNYTRRS